MKIGIDARIFGPPQGIGRYTQRLVENFEIIDSENEYFIFLSKDGYKLYQPGRSNFHKVLADYPLYGWQEQLSLPFLWRRHSLDVLHVPHFNVPLLTSLFHVGVKKSLIVTIHDLIHLKFNPQSSTRSKLFYFLKYIFSRFLTRLAIKRTGKILAVSEFVKKDIISHYKINPQKITVTYESF